MARTDSEILTILYNNFDPDQRADATFYVDCTDVRGSDEFARKLCNDLSRTDSHIHMLFSGNIGCGKSSELQHFADMMEDNCPPEGRKRFLPVIIDTSAYLDRADVKFEDILLAIVGEMAEVLRNKTDIVFRSSLVENLLDTVRSYVPSSLDAQVGGIKLGGTEGAIAQAKLTFQRLQKDPTGRQKVRDALKERAQPLRDDVNEALIEARTQLQNFTVPRGHHTYSDFVIILDNLEKVERFEDNVEGDASHRALFIQKSEQLTGLSTHIVFTVPLSILRAEGGKLSQRYSGDPFILPNIKTEQRGSEHNAYALGIERLKEILRRRVPPGITLEEVFEPEALDFIIMASGGHVRNLLRFARESVSYNENSLPITLRSAHRSIGRQVRLFTDILRPTDWTRLAELERSDVQAWDSQDPAKSRLLEQIAVLEYVNGGDDNPFNEVAPWYIVNPIIRQMRPFQKAMAQPETDGEPVT